MSYALRALAAVAIAGYGATATMVGAGYWADLSKEEVQTTLERVQFQIPPVAKIFTPIVAVLTRPAWAAMHGLLWPLVFWINRRPRRSDDA